MSISYVGLGIIFAVIVLVITLFLIGGGRESDHDQDGGQGDSQHGTPSLISMTDTLVPAA